MQYRVSRLAAELLGYQPGLGGRISFKLAYKQREDRVITTNFFSLGKMWNCSWLSYITDDPANLSAHTTLAGGGDRTYVPDGATREFYSNTLLRRDVDGYNVLATSS